MRRKIVAVPRIELIEVVEVRDESSHSHHVFEIHTCGPEDLTDIRQRLPRLALDATRCELGANRVAPGMARQIQRVARQDARREWEAGVWGLLGTNCLPAAARLLGVHRLLKRNAEQDTKD